VIQIYLEEIYFYDITAVIGSEKNNSGQNSKISTKLHRLQMTAAFESMHFFHMVSDAVDEPKLQKNSVSFTRKKVLSHVPSFPRNPTAAPIVSLLVMDKCPCSSV